MNYDELFERADNLTERCVAICAKGKVAIRKEDLYALVFPLMLRHVLEGNHD